MAYTRRTTGSRKRMFRTAGVIGALALGASLMAAPRPPPTTAPPPSSSWTRARGRTPARSTPPPIGPTPARPTRSAPPRSTARARPTSTGSTGRTRPHPPTRSESRSPSGSSSGPSTRPRSRPATVTPGRPRTPTPRATRSTSRLYRKGWIERGTAKQQATGWYELHFGSRYYGHYIWYINNYQSSGFNNDQPSTGFINFKDAEMTSGERSAHCG